MVVAVLGTGTVGRTIAAKLGSIGIDVLVGTRDVANTNARSTDDSGPAFADWHAAHPAVTLDTFAGTASAADVVINATNGGTSLQALTAAGAKNLGGKILIDLSNPLDFSRGFPPTLSVSNTDSLGEQIQRAFPDARVVKTLNTVTSSVMVDPAALADGNHSVFVCGDDDAAKASVTEYLKEWFGWIDVIDLGDISASRGTEMYLPLWLRLWGVVGDAGFNIKVVR